VKTIAATSAIAPQRRHLPRGDPAVGALRAHEVVLLEEPLRVEAVEVGERRHHQLLPPAIPDVVAHWLDLYSGPSSAAIASATRTPSTADDVIPPA
jgi:hypothetical protein